jgi:hypothetical protein
MAFPIGEGGSISSQQLSSAVISSAASGPFVLAIQTGAELLEGTKDNGHVS